jgi:hypothetical protein
METLLLKMIQIKDDFKYFFAKMLHLDHVYREPEPESGSKTF